MTAIGKARRMSRLFRKSSGRMLCLPVDHGLMVGPVAGVADPGPLLDIAVSAEVDALIVTPGSCRRITSVSKAVLPSFCGWTRRPCGGPVQPPGTRTRTHARS